VIVIDDASTDDSRELLSSHARDGKITLLVNDVLRGVAASRSRAMAHAASDLVTTLDADDYYYGNEKLAAEATTMQGHPRRIGFSDVIRVTVSGKVLGRVAATRRLREGDLASHIRNLNGFIPRDYLVSRVEYIAAGGYNPSLEIYEDWDLKVRLSTRCTWHYTGQIGTAYRVNPQGLSRAPRAEHIVAMRRVFSLNCPARSAIGRAAAFARFFVHQSIFLRRPALLPPWTTTKSNKTGTEL
jgi:glycosyltransferase involved in cell wall biosynthesis